MLRPTMETKKKAARKAAKKVARKRAPAKKAARKRPARKLGKPDRAARDASMAEACRRRKAVFLTKFAEGGGHITNACKAAGVTRTTFYSWKAEDRTFARQYEEAEAGLVDHVAGRLLLNVEAGDQRAIEFWLGKTPLGRKHGYGVDRVEVTGRDGGPLQQSHTVDLGGVADLHPAGSVRDALRDMLAKTDRVRGAVEKAGKG